MILDGARSFARKLPLVRRLARLVIPQPGEPPAFGSSSRYWDDRYKQGGTSGAGSYGRLARFKAEVLNQFVADHHVNSVIEFGCGDGAQLGLAAYPHYVGLDVSEQAVALCREKFAADPTKRFVQVSDAGAGDLTADLAMSLDVIYHLVEDQAYEPYMRRLVAAGNRFLCVYSSNVDKPGLVPHVRHRCFTDWIAAHAPGWRPALTLPNRFPEDPANPDETSWADFHFFEKIV